MKEQIRTAIKSSVKERRSGLAKVLATDHVIITKEEALEMATRFYDWYYEKDRHGFNTDAEKNLSKSYVWAGLFKRAGGTEDELRQMQDDIKKKYDT